MVVLDQRGEEVRVDLVDVVLVVPLVLLLLLSSLRSTSVAFLALWTALVVLSIAILVSSVRAIITPGPLVVISRLGLLLVILASHIRTNAIA
jgi:hypothetical protein